jgi:hypothetical protein
MTAHDNYLDPDRHNLYQEAYEIKIGGVPYAWDEDGYVYRYDPADTTARDDGFVLIGNLAWPDDEEHPATALREFVMSLSQAWGQP